MKTLPILVNKFASLLLGLINRGGSLPGSLALKVNHSILKELKIKGKVIVVTGTNGKTSTSNMIADMLIHAGKSVISNRKGDNLKEGITTQLLNHADLSGVIHCDYCVLECDELNIPYIVNHIPVDTLVITNFFRDQLDRAREMEQLIQKLESALKDYSGNLILNGNDPNVVRFAHSCPQAHAHYFTMDRYSGSMEDAKEVSEGKFCPCCTARLHYDYYQYSHIGSFHCPKCGFETPHQSVCGNVADLEAHTFTYRNETFQAMQGGLYTMYNCMAVLAAAEYYQIDIQHAKAIFQEMEVPFGRNETFAYNGHKLILNLIKNPTGANEVMKVMEQDKSDKTILFVLNDNPQDGTDISWIYDTFFEKIMREDTLHIICSGTRCYDMALRLKYGGWHQQIQIEEDLNKACEALLQADSERYAVVTYTALSNTRKLLRRKMK